MSNRTRSRPLEIYTKLNTHLAQLHDQVSQFNKTSHTIHAITRNSRYGDSSTEIRLKAMTQPKYQELLLNCELPFSDKHTKTGRLQRKISTKTGKEFKSFGLTSSLNSNPGIRAKV